MTPQTSIACPKCQKPLTAGTRFCAHCGNDISGVWSSDPALGSTLAVEADAQTDALGALLRDATLGDYDIYGELGRGGMAAVYLALDLALNRKVAIKTMLPELLSREGMVQRFKREAQTSAALNHPHIIQIYTVKQSKQLVYFVMKFIEGRSLESVITDKGHVPLGMAQTILGQVGGALAYAHRKGVVHRDVKPANIMIDEDGWAIVTDFGIAKVSEAQNLTATGTAIGTPHYMSPEQFHNKAVTGQSDQYSLGVVAYEMLAGKKPFDGATYAEIITQHLFEAVPDLRKLRPDVPGHVVDVINKMLAKDPADRYPDLDAAIAALGAPESRSEGDVVRTQMISLAKSGPQKKVRMSVPMSPVPVQKRQSPPALEATVIEPGAAKRARPRPRAASESTGSSRRWIGLALVSLLMVAGGGYAALRMNLIPLPAARDTTARIVLSGQGSPAAPDSSAVTGAASDSQSAGLPPAATAAATESKRIADSVAAAVKDSLLTVARNDSIQRERRRADSVRTARRRRDSVAVAERPVTTRPAGSAPAAIVATPAVPAAPGTVKIGSRTPDAALYINGTVEALLNALRDVTVPSGANVRLSIRAAGCEPWDTVVAIAPGSANKIGYRSAKCP